jgi:tetratricopeptide (TPR) repeat protein
MDHGAEKKRGARRRAARAAAAILLIPFLCAASDAEQISRRRRLDLAARAQELMRSGDFAAAAERLEKASSPGAKKKDLAQWQAALGDCYEALSNYQKALTARQEAHRLQPKDLAKLSALARLYEKVGLNDSAVAAYEKVYKKTRGRRDAALALARLHLAAGRAGPARDYAEKALSAEPRDPAARRLMARVEEAEGEWAAAAHRWEILLSRDPSGADYFHLGLLWARQGQDDLAEASFKKAQENGMAAGPCLFQRGLLEWNRGNDRAAARLWSQAQERGDASALPDFFLALNELKNGSRARAASLMRRAEEKAGSAYVDGLAGRFLELTAAAPASEKN